MTLCRWRSAVRPALPCRETRERAAGQPVRDPLVQRRRAHRAVELARRVPIQHPPVQPFVPALLADVGERGEQRTPEPTAPDGVEEMVNLSTPTRAPLGESFTEDVYVAAGPVWVTVAVWVPSGAVAEIV